MSSASGLSEQHRAEARGIIVDAARLLVAHAPEVHYTQGPKRWAISRHLSLEHPSAWFPFYGDCSSTDSFLLWLALGRHFHLGDHVNGVGWGGGFTGTMVGHGKPVRHDSNLRVGDQLFYGSPPNYEHVTTSLGGRKCFSHGGERGPYILDIDYRPDRGPTRRYI